MPTTALRVPHTTTTRSRNERRSRLRMPSQAARTTKTRAKTVTIAWSPIERSSLGRYPDAARA